MVRTALISLALFGAFANDHGLSERAAPVLERPEIVPRALIERVTNDYRKALALTEHQIVQTTLIQPVIELSAAKYGVLSEDARWVMAPGGGVFDFAKVIDGHHPGAFSLKLSLRDEAGAGVVPTRIYFLPRAKTRRLDGIEFGDGCDNFMEMKAKFTNRIERGIELYTAGQRYASTVGGTFILVVHAEKELRLAHVTFIDSRYPQLYCE